MPNIGKYFSPKIFFDKSQAGSRQVPVGSLAGSKQVLGEPLAGLAGSVESRWVLVKSRAIPDQVLDRSRQSLWGVQLGLSQVLGEFRSSLEWIQAGSQISPRPVLVKS
jgi:hypothetical protein